VNPKRPETPNIAATVYRDLTRQILSGALSPGSRLPGERELALHYKTNRNTLREAVRRLEQTRLVTVRHGQGVTVSDFRRTGTMELLSPLLESTTDYAELAMIVRDLLPARLIVIEFAARLAVERADRGDIERLRDITDLLVSAAEIKDTNIIAKGFQRWLDALIDAAHSVAIRWVANPFLESYREVLERFPALWVLDPNFADHLRRFHKALEAGDVDAAISALHNYYERVDGVVKQSFDRISHAVPSAAASGSANAKSRSTPKAP
jgi:GntR family transcriptional regulator, transcriptional repressor for pyruvate dehydrogenase complex